MESPEEEKLLVAWVNSLGMPHCLLVDSYRDMLDGNALSEIIASKFDERKKKKKRTLSSSIEYLGRKFGWSSLPPFLSRRDAADMISLGEYRGMRDLLRFLRRMYEGKDYEDEDGEDSEEDRQQRHSASYRDSKDSTERQQRRIVPRTSVPITSIQSPVYPSSNNLTVEQMDTIEWISRWLQEDTNSWKEISESFKDGILMCEVVQDVFKVRLAPPYTEPKGAFESIQNLKVALDGMRQCGVISKWLYSAEAIERGLYPEALLGVLHDLRKSVLEDERKGRPHVSIRPSNLQNERVRRVLRWIRSLGLDMELLGIVDDENLQRTYRHRHNQGTKHTYLDDCVRNGSLLNALASVLVPSARLEKPYLRPQSVDECEINLSVALQTLQSASLLDKDLDIQAIAFAM
eukprot:g5370.t1